MKTLAERLRWARGKTGLSQRGLAKLAKLKSERHICQLETGERLNPELKTLTAIADTLGLRVGWLASGEGDAPEETEIRAAVVAREAAKGAA